MESPLVVWQRSLLEEEGRHLDGRALVADGLAAPKPLSPASRESTRSSLVRMGPLRNISLCARSLWTAIVYNLQTNQPHNALCKHPLA